MLPWAWIYLNKWVAPLCGPGPLWGGDSDHSARVKCKLGHLQSPPRTGWEVDTWAKLESITDTFGIVGCSELWAVNFRPKACTFALKLHAENFELRLFRNLQEIHCSWFLPIYSQDANSVVKVWPILLLAVICESLSLINFSPALYRAVTISVSPAHVCLMLYVTRTMSRYSPAPHHRAECVQN